MKGKFLGIETFFFLYIVKKISGIQMRGELKKNNVRMEIIMGGLLLIIVSILAISPESVIEPKKKRINSLQKEQTTEKEWY